MDGVDGPKRLLQTNVTLANPNSLIRFMSCYERKTIRGLSLHTLIKPHSLLFINFLLVHFFGGDG